MKEELLQKLFQLKNEKYKAFHSSLVLNSKYEILGVRVPLVRNLVKKIDYNEIFNILDEIGNTYYEEVLFEGLLISRIKEEDKFNMYFNKYIPKIDNWALCDTFCSSVKIIRNYESKYFNIAIHLAKTNDEFISRIGLILILNHFGNEQNLPKIFKVLNQIKSDKYYVNMAEAWLLCDLYIKYPAETLEFLKSSNLNEFTLRKTISKVQDSYRVSAENKEILKKENLVDSHYSKDFCDN